MPDTVRPEVAEYLQAALAAIEDVDEPAREELAESIESAVLEVAAEFEDDLNLLLGPPERFAAELRSAAGIPPGGKPGGLVRRWRARWRDRAHEALGAEAAWRSTGFVPRAEAWLRELLPELRPGWWVLRGYALAWLVPLIAGPVPRADWVVLVPFPNWTAGQSLSATLLSVMATVAVIVVSVELGRRRLSGWRNSAVMALNLVAVLSLMTIADSLRFGAQPVVMYEAYEQPVLPEPYPTGPPVFLNGIEVVGLETPEGSFVPVDGASLIDVYAQILAEYPPDSIGVITGDGGWNYFSSVEELARALEYPSPTTMIGP